MNDLLFSEILELFQKAETRKEKIAVLQKNGDAVFQEFLYCAFHPNIKFDVEVPQYKPSTEPAGLNYSYLRSEMNKIYRFIVNHPKREPNLTSKKQSQLLVVILESLHKDEAELFVKLIKKDLGVKYLTLQIVREAFPNLNLPPK
jgi:hypothetical protein